jgi:hypothetical protein
MNPEPNPKPTKPNLSYVITGLLGLVLVFQFGTMKAEGPTTSAMKNFGNFGGGALCLISLIQVFLEVRKQP